MFNKNVPMFVTLCVLNPCLSDAPGRPPPPKSYSPERHSAVAPPGASSVNSTLKLPKAKKPPKLQHILVKRRHNLVKAVPRDDGIMKAPGKGTQG